MSKRTDAEDKMKTDDGNNVMLYSETSETEVQISFYRHYFENN